MMNLADLDRIAGMADTAPATRTSDEITADIDALGGMLQHPGLHDGARTAIYELLTELRDELVAAVDQEEVTAAEHAAWGRPEQYL
jgi:hypothetical protein